MINKILARLTTANILIYEKSVSNPVLSSIYRDLFSKELARTGVADELYSVGDLDPSICAATEVLTILERLGLRFADPTRPQQRCGRGQWMRPLSEAIAFQGQI